MNHRKPVSFNFLKPHVPEIVPSGSNQYFLNDCYELSVKRCKILKNVCFHNETSQPSTEVVFKKKQLKLDTLEQKKCCL